MKSNAQKFDVREKVTAAIIEAMETKGLKWIHYYINDGGTANFASGNRYRGLINNVLLSVSALKHEYTSPYWMTYKQAKDMGAQVRKGEHGTLITYYGDWKKDVENDDGETETLALKVLKGYYVFNIEQIDGIPEKMLKKREIGIVPTNKRIAKAERIVKNSGAKIMHGACSTACYTQELDCVYMPKIELCKSSEMYYATLMHELIHWTGHPARLDRPMGGAKKSEKYAFEELIAELGAAYMGAETGIYSQINNSAAYIKSWIKFLRSDKTYIFKAAAAASKAASYILDRDAAAQTKRKSTRTKKAA